MEYIILLVLIILFIVIMGKFTSIQDKVDYINNRLSNLSIDVKKINEQLDCIKINNTIQTSNSVEETKVEIENITIHEVVTPIIIQEVEQKVESVNQILEEISKEQTSEKPIFNQLENTQQFYYQAPPKATKPKKPTFFERNPDLEKFIGENLINKIGIAILVLGIGFFVKFAIDQNWINEVGRVLIGILCGGILVGVAHYLRKSFAAFSSVLIGGGISVFYFTIALAFREYAIISQPVAFGIMVIITIFAVLVSILYNRQELAVLAILGGFVAPLLLSTGSGNYIVLFSYVLILISGMLILAYFKKWVIVNIVSYVFTILLFGIWLVTKTLGVKDAPYLGALIFATIYYFVFFLMNIVNNIKENEKFKPLDISILLSNTALYFSAGMCILNYIQNGAFQGLFTGFIAFFNLIFAYSLYKKKNVDTNLLFFLIGIVLTFISLAAPIQLKGNYITMFWALESVLLLWLYQKSDIKIFKTSSLLVTVLMIVSLLIDWTNNYNNATIEYVLLNKTFITGAISLLALLATNKLLKKEEGLLLPNFAIEHYQNLIKILAIGVCYFLGLLEIFHQLETRFHIHEITELYTEIYNYALISILTYFLIKLFRKEHQFIFVILTVITFLSYLFHYQIIIRQIRNAYLYAENINVGVYLSHYILIALLVSIFVQMLKVIIAENNKKTEVFTTAMWLFCGIMVIVSSIEVDHLILTLTFNPKTNIYEAISSIHKIGYPILWGLSSFIMMVVGMKQKIKSLRIISLTLFAITLLKLFIFDIRNMSEGGKIGAFISLGLILLVISFLYQKLKKIVTEDDNHEIENN